MDEIARREPLPLQEMHGSSIAAAQMDFVLFAELMEHVSIELGIPVGKLRPSDRFAVELAPVTREWDNGYGILIHELVSMAKEKKLTVVGKIESIDDYLGWMAKVY